jgi:hypothetical protein
MQAGCGSPSTLPLAHGLETLIAAAEKLQPVSPQVLFLLVGEGAERERITALAKSKKLNNIRFVPQQSRGKIPAYISVSDACLVLLKKSEVFETVIPTKMLEVMSCGRPVILGVNGEAHRILENSRSGIHISPEDPCAEQRHSSLSRNIPQCAKPSDATGASTLWRTFRASTRLSDLLTCCGDYSRARFSLTPQPSYGRIATMLTAVAI